MGLGWQHDWAHDWGVEWRRAVFCEGLCTVKESAAGGARLRAPPDADAADLVAMVAYVITKLLSSGRCAHAVRHRQGGARNSTPPFLQPVFGTLSRIRDTFSL
jgi:hypothetical protein